MHIPQLQGPVNLFSSQQASALLRSEKVDPGAGLPVDRWISAQVVDVDGDSVVLDIQGGRYQTSLQEGMAKGQVLQLQLLKSEPQLEFKVAPQVVMSRFEQIVPLLTKSYDWSQLAQRLQDMTANSAELAAFKTPLDQFRQVLAADPLPEEVTAMIRQLANALKRGPTALNSGFVREGFIAPGQLSRLPAGIEPRMFLAVLQKVEQLQQKGEQLLQQVKPDAVWYREARQLLGAIARDFEQISAPVQLQQRIALVLKNLQQSPGVSLQFRADVQRLADTLQSQQRISEPYSQDLFGPAGGPAVRGADVAGTTTPEAAAEGTTTSAALVKRADTVGMTTPEVAVKKAAAEGAITSAASVKRSDTVGMTTSEAAVKRTDTAGMAIPAASVKTPEFSEVAGAPANVRDPAGSFAPISAGRGELPTAAAPGAAAELSQMLEKLLDHGGLQTPLPPYALGRLEGVLDRIRSSAQVAPELVAKLEGMLQQVAHVTHGHSAAPLAEQLGFMSMFFGLSVERELLHGKFEQSFNRLQELLQRLSAQPDTDLDEPLKRLEFFQLCREKLGQEQVQFLPLPFPQLEEGYLIADRRPSQSENRNESQDALQMSLSLRLSALGNLRVDMLYDQHGLRLQLACEDQDKMRYVERFSEDLRARLGAVKLLSLGFRDDARQPVAELQQRVSPQTASLLNARI